MSDVLHVIVTTYDSGDGSRTWPFESTVIALVEKLVYNDIHYIITDDSSSEVHENHVKDMRLLLEENLIPHTIINTNRKGVGFAKNNALKLAFQTSPYVLLTEDDWELVRPLNVSSYIKTLSEYSEVGIIRFGFLGGEMSAQYTSYAGTTYWKLLHKTGFYVYSGQVSLRSKNWYDRMGYHAEGVSPGREEEEMCHRYSDMKDVPVILWPAEFGTTLNAGPFVNVGLDSSVNGVEPIL